MKIYYSFLLVLLIIGCTESENYNHFEELVSEKNFEDYLIYGDVHNAFLDKIVDGARF